MARKALSERHGPQLVKVTEPEIGWSPADRIEPGEYPAYSSSEKISSDPQFRRWVCAVQFDVLDASLTRVLARLTWFLNLGARDKPHAGRRSNYWRAWTVANSKPPARRDRVTPQVFVRRQARVTVADTEQDHRQRPVTESSRYSVVREVLKWHSGETE